MAVFREKNCISACMFCVSVINCNQFVTICNEFVTGKIWNLKYKNCKQEGRSFP